MSHRRISRRSWVTYVFLVLLAVGLPAAAASPLVAVVVGPTGSDVSTDGGHTWTLFDEGSFDSVDCESPNTCWASGEQGRVARLVITRG